MRRLVLLGVVLAGCGRVGFDAVPVAGDAGDGDGPSDARVNAAPGLIAYFPFDETSFAGSAYDASGFGRDATCSVGSTCPTPALGAIGGAAAFDGSTQFFEIPFQPVFNTTTGFTVAVWISTTTTSPISVIAKPYQTGAANAYQLYGGGAGSISFTYISGSSGSSSLGQVALVTNQWSHLAAVWDTTMVRLYFDGSEIASAPANDLLFDNSPVQIGADTDGGTLASYFAGRIDEVRIYDHGLTTTEIAALAAMP